jgi:hypothetical protein
MWDIVEPHPRLHIHEGYDVQHSYSESCRIYLSLAMLGPYIKLGLEDSVPQASCRSMLLTYPP